jgi:hypothetical protein
VPPHDAFAKASMSCSIKTRDWHEP